MREGAAGKAAYTAQHRAVGDPSRGEHDIAMRHVEEAIFAIEIGDAEALGAAALVVIAEEEPPLHLPADAAQCRRREYALRRAARTHVDVDAGVGARGGDDAGHIAVADQHDARAGLAHLRDQIGVARSVEDADDEIGNLGLFGARKVLQILSRRRVEIDDTVGQPAADRDLIHIHVRRVEKAAIIGHRQDGERVGAALGGDRRAFERVERDVDFRPLPRPDRLADIQHRRLVALALADHDRAVDRQAVQRLPHRIDGGLVGGLLVAPPHQPRSRQRRQLGDANRFEREIAIHPGVVGHGFLPRGTSEIFDADHARRLEHGAERRDPLDRALHRRLDRNMRRQDDGHRLTRRAAALDHRFHRHMLVAKRGRDIGDDAGLIDDHQADVVGALMPLHRGAGQRVERSGGDAERRHIAAGRDIDEIGGHR